MGKYEIPEPYKWNEEFKVFYESLDEEHKGLFDGIFAVCGDKGSQTVLDDLRAKVKAHFATEEAMMTKASYDKYEDHKKLHEAFVEELGKVTVPCTDDTLMFAKNWLVEHIKDNDFLYKGKLE